MNLKFQNSARNARFNSGVKRLGCIGLLACAAAFIVPAAISHPKAFVTASLLGTIIPASRHGMRFLKEEDDNGGGVGDSVFRKTVLDGVTALQEKQKTFETNLAKAASAEEFTSLKKEFDELLETVRKVQRTQLTSQQTRSTRAGQVSDECARFLGAVFLQAQIRQERITGARKDFAEGFIKEVFEAHGKSALTTSEIPLPTAYSADIVELVSIYGNARKYGTVFPLGTGTLKLPALGTDPDFGLIAASGTVTEKSPTFAWVTFTAEKFGGLVRFPTEIEEDSIVGLGQFLARYSARKVAKCEDYQFFASTGAGSGVNGSVKGLLLSTIDNSKVVQMASTKTKYTDATLAYLRQIRAVVDEAVLGDAAYYLHPTFEQHLAGLNTAGDKPYIANGINGASLDGFPIRWVNTMPTYVTTAQVSKVFVLFGDLSYQYLAPRAGIKFDTSKEAGFTTDETLVRALERFTIGLMANGAVSGLETAAS